MASSRQPSAGCPQRDSGERRIEKRHAAVIIGVGPGVRRIGSSWGKRSRPTSRLGRVAAHPGIAGARGLGSARGVPQRVAADGARSTSRRARPAHRAPRRPLRTRQGDPEQQPAVLEVGVDLQGPDDDGGRSNCRDLVLMRHGPASLPWNRRPQTAANAPCPAQSVNSGEPSKSVAWLARWDSSR